MIQAEIIIFKQLNGEITFTKVLYWLA